MDEYRNPLLKIISIMVILIFAGSMGFYFLSGGKESFTDCLFMTVITLSTVGYGEVIDVSSNPALRIYTIILVTFGVGILLYALSAFTAFVVEGHFSGYLRRKRMMKQIGELEGHCIVCGGGDTGYYVVDEMLKCGWEVVLIDKNQENLGNCMKLGDIKYIVGDATDDHNLEDANIEKARGVVVALPSDKDNLYIVMTAKILNPDIRIIAIGQHEHIETKMRRAGANGVVSPNFIGGLRLASEMIRPATVEFLDTMLRGTGDILRVGEVCFRERSPFIGKTLAEVDFPGKHNLVVLARKKEGAETFEYNPPSDYILEEGDVLIFMGFIKDIKKIELLALKG